MFGFLVTNLRQADCLIQMALTGGDKFGLTARLSILLQQRVQRHERDIA